MLSRLILISKIGLIRDVLKIHLYYIYKTIIYKSYLKKVRKANYLVIPKIIMHVWSI